FRVFVSVDIRNVGYVISMLLQPVSQLKFPQQVFAGALRERLIHHLRIPAVGSVEADPGAGTVGLLGLIRVVKRVLVGPLVIGLPSGVAALKHQVSLPVVTNDEDDVTLVSVGFAGKFAQVNPTQPIIGNHQPSRSLPLTLSQSVFSNGRRCLRGYRERAKSLHKSPPFASII